MKMLRAVIPAIGAFLSALYFAVGSAAAADIKILDSHFEIKYVSVEGEIADGDADRFYHVVENLDRATIILHSPGGLVKEALEIGAEIRSRNFATMVLADGECYSACGLIWVSGARRYMAPTSQIGFHAAYVNEGGQYRESGAANAEVGSFLTNLGLRIEAIRYFTIAGPSDMSLLTSERARALGIDVYVQNGMEFITPTEVPVVDTYVERFLAYASLKRCFPYFKLDPAAIDRGARNAFDNGNAIVGSDQWIKLWMQRMDQVKLEAQSRGTLLHCLDIERQLAADGQQTGIDGPSFACSAATTKTEMAICGDPSMWAKDRAISSIYFWIRDNVEPVTRKRLLAIQREWLGMRNDCGGDGNCLNSVYDQRLLELREIDIAG